MSVLSIGSMNLDYVYQVPHLARPGETLMATAMETKAGGKGLNQTLALARAGATVRHAGCIGSEGAVLRDLLAENGVDVSLVQTVEAPQGSAFIQVDQTTAQNSIVVSGGSNRALTPERVEELLESAQPKERVVLQNEVSSMREILAGCAEHGLPVILNPAPYSDDIATMDLSPVEWLIVTLGEQGSICFHQNERIVQEAYKVKAVDTTAAGDTFIGYFVAGLEESLPLAQCLRQASVASAIAVTRPGAAPSIPWKRELLDFGA